MQVQSTLEYQEVAMAYQKLHTVYTNRKEDQERLFEWAGRNDLTRWEPGLPGSSGPYKRAMEFISAAQYEAEHSVPGHADFRGDDFLDHAKMFKGVGKTVLVLLPYPNRATPLVALQELACRYPVRLSEADSWHGDGWATVVEVWLRGEPTLLPTDKELSWGLWVDTRPSNFVGELVHL